MRKIALLLIFSAVFHYKAVSAADNELQERGAISSGMAKNDLTRRQKGAGELVSGMQERYAESLKVSRRKTTEAAISTTLNAFSAGGASRLASAVRALKLLAGGKEKDGKPVLKDAFLRLSAGLKKRREAEAVQTPPPDSEKKPSDETEEPPARAAKPQVSDISEEDIRNLRDKSEASGHPLTREQAIAALSE